MQQFYRSYKKTLTSQLYSMTTLCLTPHELHPPYLQDNKVVVLPWLVFSSDLNPIVHLSDELGRRLYDGRGIISKRDELIHTPSEEWEAILQYRI